jgi:hypothetical protein
MCVSRILKTTAGWYPWFSRSSGNPTVWPVSERSGVAPGKTGLGSSQSRGCKCCFVYDQPSPPVRLGRPPPAPFPRQLWWTSGVKEPRTCTHARSFSLSFALSLSLSLSLALPSLVSQMISRRYCDEDSLRRPFRPFLNKRDNLPALSDCSLIFPAASRVPFFAFLLLLLFRVCDQDREWLFAYNVEECSFSENDTEIFLLATSITTCLPASFVSSFYWYFTFSFCSFLFFPVTLRLWN